MARGRVSLTGGKEPTADGESGSSGDGPGPDVGLLGAERPEPDTGGADTGGDDTGDYQLNSDGSIKRNADGTPRRKRRKRGSGGGNRTASAKKGSGQLSVDALENALNGVHGMLALSLKAPEMLLDADESKPYAKALAEVASYYDMPNVTGEAIAWIGLCMVMGKIYAPRVVMIGERLRSDKAKPVPQNPIETGLQVLNPDNAFYNADGTPKVV